MCGRLVPGPSRVSHELRTPLTGILGSAQNLRDGVAGGLSREQQDYVHMIEQDSGRLIRVVNELLEWGRLQSGQYRLQCEPVAIQPLLDDVVMLVRPAADRKGVDLQNGRIEGTHIGADADKLKQILINLVDNAVKFTPPGSRVRVQVRSDAGDLQGETGTGKEVIARALHTHSTRCDEPFVAVNCANLQGELLESELFGHERGAFTGADRARAGRVETARGGTLFLDEIGELPPDLQTRLLRLLQEKEYQRLGSDRTQRADVHVIAATHRDLPLAIRQGTFREDLYYRLRVISLTIPPLRERPADIRPLAEWLLDKHASDAGRRAPWLSDDVGQVLLRSSWPGNVRELSNVMVSRLVKQLGIRRDEG